MKKLWDLLVFLAITVGVTLVVYGIPTLIVYWLFWAGSNDDWIQGIVMSFIVVQIVCSTFEAAAQSRADRRRREILEDWDRRRTASGGTSSMSFPS
ncbi:MAG: hypothetical protein ACPGVU_15830 [Limisphaerales bacterium]